MHFFKSLCYNEVMVRIIHITKFGGLAILALSLLSPAFIINNSYATPSCTTNNTTGVRTCEDQGTFQVSVDEILTVDVAKPETWVSGDVGDFLTNIVSLKVATNNVSGFQATMTTNTESDTATDATATGTKLVNNLTSSSTIETLGGSTTLTSTGTDYGKEFPTNRWGFGLTGLGGTAPMSYSPVVAKNAATPSVVLSSNTSTDSNTSGTDIYFGAKAGTGTLSGTYEETMVISVVSGVHDDNTPTTPTNPDTPVVDPTNNDQGTIAYNPSSNTTVYTNNYTSGTTEHRYSEVTSGNNSSNYDGYTYPQGEVNTVATINEGTPLATGLAVTAGVAAASGIFFFILAKRRKDDDEEEDY